MTQESRQAEIQRPAVKELIKVEMIERLPELVIRAFQVATTGRPGPVVLDIPEDICHASYPFNPEDLDVPQIHQQIPNLRTRPDSHSINEAAQLLKNATRPLILAGGGIHLSDAAQTLESFAETFSLPVAHTMTGKGSISCNNPLSAGLFGRYDRIANQFIETSDCLLVIGCKLGEIATKRFTLPPKNIPVIHLEVVAEEIGRTLQPTIALWGDAKEGIKDLASVMQGTAEEQNEKRATYIEEVSKSMGNWRNSVNERLTSDEVPINMARLMHELNNELPEDAILVADGGFAVGGERREDMNARIIKSATINMHNKHNQRDTSPYILQNRRGRATRSRVFSPLLLLTIKMTPNTRVASHRSSVPFFSQTRRRIYHAKMNVKTNVQSALTDPHAPSMVRANTPSP